MLVASVQGKDQPRQPNVVVFLADDLGWRDTSLYGSTFYEAPCIDRLAQRGMRFTNAYAACPLCSPTRASLLTGLYPCRVGMTIPNGHIREEVLTPVLPKLGPPAHKAITPEPRNRLLLEYVTIAESLHDAGYATAHFGKWHLGWEPYDPGHQGFDLAIPGGSYPGPPGTYFSPYKAPIFRDAPKGEHIEDLVSREAVKWIENHKNEPFFLNYWLFSVHSPWDGGKAPLVEKYTQKADPKSPQRNPIMGAMVETMDTCIGRVLDKLDELGLTNDTIIIFTSDNGGVSWQDVEGSPVTSNLPLRNGKGSIYEGGTREPAIVVWPGKVEAGSTSDAVISTIDYHPTILEVLGLKPKSGQAFDGVSIVPALTKTGPLPREALFCHFPHNIPATENLPATWVRRGDWKLIRFYADNPDQTDRFELYNLKDDIGETRNQAGSHPDLVRELNALITRHLKDTGALVPVPNPAYNPDPLAWTTGGHDARVKREGGELVVTSTGNDPIMMVRDIPESTGPLVFTFRMKSTSRGQGQFFWSPQPQGGYQRSRSVFFPVRHDGQWHEYHVEVPPGERVRSLRLGPSTAPGEMRFSWLKLTDQSYKVIREWRFDESR